VTNANRKRQLAVETAAKEGLRASVPLYIAAAEAFAQEDRPAQSVELLGELLRAKEKRRGFLGRVEKNPLGPERARVATKYAEFARTASPTEDTLEMLNDLATEFQESTAIRRANADGLRNAGYAADAIEEYRYCWKLEPEDGDIPVRLSELYAALGRSDEAIEHLRKGVALHAARGEFEQVAERAMRFIDLNPDGLDDVYASLELIPGDVLRKHVPSLDHLGVLVRRDPAREAEWRSGMEQRLVDLYTRVLEVDTRNAAARRGINVLGPRYLADVEAKLRAASRLAAPSTVAASAAAPPEVEVEAPVPAAAQAAPANEPAREAAPAAPAQQPTREPEDIAVPELVEKSPGELVAEETADVSAAVEAPAEQAKAAAAPAPGTPAPAAATPAQTSPAAAKPTPQAPASAPQAPAAAAASQKPTPPSMPSTPAPAPALATAPATAQPEPAKAETPAAAPATPAAAPVPAQAAAAAPDKEAHPTAAAAGAPASAPSKALYAFALRKAQEQFDAGIYEEAAAACERILKRGEIAEVLSLLARSYIKLERKQDAVGVCMRFADATSSESPAKALAAFTDLIKALPDPALILRRSQLLTSARQVEFVGKDR
jgi:tetratricopeptide (TPR) repeat protein